MYSDMLNPDYQDKKRKKFEGMKFSDYADILNNEVAKRTRDKDKRISELEEQLKNLDAKNAHDLELAQMAIDGTVQVELIKAKSVQDKYNILRSIAEIRQEQEIEKTRLGGEYRLSVSNSNNNSRLNLVTLRAQRQVEIEQLKAQLKLDHAIKLHELKNESVGTSKDVVQLKVLGILAGLMAIPAMVIATWLIYSAIHAITK